MKTRLIKEKTTNLMHLNSNRASGLDRALLRNRRSSRVTPHSVARHIGNGGVGRRNTSALRAIVGTVNPEGLEDGVGGSLLGEQAGDEAGEKGRPHVGLVET